jgi:hypothetical protein
MKLQLEWARPIPLRDAGREENLLYTFDYSKLPEVTGVYVLGRRFGRTFEALYVGKAGALRGRVRGQLKNLPNSGNSSTASPCGHLILGQKSHHRVTKPDIEFRVPETQALGDAWRSTDLTPISERQPRSERQSRDGLRSQFAPLPPRGRNLLVEPRPKNVRRAKRPAWSIVIRNNR